VLDGKELRSISACFAGLAASSFSSAAPSVFQLMRTLFHQTKPTTPVPTTSRPTRDVMKISWLRQTRLFHEWLITAEECSSVADREVERKWMKVQ